METVDGRMAALGLRTMSEAVTRKCDLGGNTHAVFQPGNGTRYEVSVVDIPSSDGGPSVMFAVHNLRRCMRLARGWVHWSYVSEKLGLTRGDAEPLALLWEYLTTKVCGYCGNGNCGRDHLGDEGGYLI